MVQKMKYPILLLMLLMQSCHLSPPWLASNNSVTSIQILGSEDMNSSQALAIDAVFVYDEALVSLIAELPATEWFERKQELEFSFASNITTLQWEIAPYAVVTDVVLPPNSRRAHYGVVFANYANGGNHRIDISDIPEVTLLLGPDSVQIR